jgi:ATP-dependent Zn protease
MANRKKTRITRRDRAMAACHEAGHAVMAVIKRVRLGDVFLSRGGGWTYTAKPTNDPKDLADNVAIALAGRAAEQMVFGDRVAPWFFGSKADRDYAQDTLERLGFKTDAAKTKECERRRVYVFSALDKHWPAVQAVAGALFERGRLSGPQARRIARGARDR